VHTLTGTDAPELVKFEWRKVKSANVMRGPRRFSREQLLQSRQRCRLCWNTKTCSAQCIPRNVESPSSSFEDFSCRASMRTRNEREEMPVTVLIVSILIAVRVHVDAKSNKNPRPLLSMATTGHLPLGGAVDDRPVPQMPSVPRVSDSNCHSCNLCVICTGLGGRRSTMIH
jgi:hypothetical protein